MLIPEIKKKSKFEESLEALDLQGCLMLSLILTQRMMYLSTKDKIITNGTTVTKELKEPKDA